MRSCNECKGVTRPENSAELVERIAARIPDCGIGTDVMAGFPGETDEHFQATFDLLLELPVTYLHPFSYSVRPGSVAEGLGDKVTSEQKKRRVRALKRLSEDKGQSVQACPFGSHLARVGRTAG